MSNLLTQKIMLGDSSSPVFAALRRGSLGMTMTKIANAAYILAPRMP